MAYPKPTGSAPGADGRPRAQVSYEGEDEFSAMSLDPSRRRKLVVDLETPNSKGAPEIDDLRPPKRGVVAFFRKIFAK